MKLIFTCLLLLPFCYTSALAQKDVAQQKQDSLQYNLISARLNHLQQLSVENTSDSLRRSELQKQLASHSTGDQQQITLLLNELAALRLSDSLRRVQKRHEADSLHHYAKGFAVNPFVEVLFYVYTKQGSFLPRDRAALISSRIYKLSSQYDFRADSLKLSQAEQTCDVVYKENLIISLSDQDALWANTTKEALAAKYKVIIANAIGSYKKQTSLQTLLIQIALAILVMLVAALVVYGINKFFRLLVFKTTQKAWYNHGVKFRNYQLINAAQQLKILNTIILIIKWVIILLVVFLVLPILFSIFPFTKDISIILLGYVLSPLKKIGVAVWNYVPNLITIIIVVVIFRYVLKFFRFIRNEISGGSLTIPGFYPDWAHPTYQIMRIMILAFMLVIVFPYLPGSDSGVFKGVSVFIGVLFTFGSAGALGNIVAGLVLTYMRAFKIGDHVKIGESTGDIVSKTLLVTRIRTVQNEMISIPNSTVMNNHTMNYSTEAITRGLILNATVTIGYDSPWRTVHQLLIDAALDTPMIEKQPKPYVLQTGLDDYYVNYRINVYTRHPNQQPQIYSYLFANIQDQFNKAGIEIMSPHYHSLRDGNTISIPPEYIPTEYRPSAFNIKKEL